MTTSPGWRADGAVLVVGASGATGRLLVEQLLGRGHRVRVVVRSPDRLPIHLRNHPYLSVVHASLLDLGDDEMIHLVTGCMAIASCLGHNLSLKGIFGAPRRLVTDATRRLCEAVHATRPVAPVKFVLMNTAGNSDRELGEPISFAQRCVLGFIRLLLPPQVDNEMAAEYLRTHNGPTTTTIEWVAVRPDSLIDQGVVTEYELHPSPTRSAIFDPGQTSRINVAHLMADLISDDGMWSSWKGRMPVIYNTAASLSRSGSAIPSPVVRASLIE